MDLKSKVVLVTGASQGIGRATAAFLSKKGASVVINYRKNEKAAREVLEECDKHSRDNLCVKADITKETDVEKMFGMVKSNYKKLDALVNNAGIFDERDGPTNLKAFENIFSVNFLAQIRVVKYALKIMKKGKIINVSSVHGKIGHGLMQSLILP